MNLAHLRYFETLVQTKSYQETARIESVSQPTLSQAINGLEKELGAPLFIRKKGSVELTREGLAFSNYVRASLRFLDNGIDYVQSTSGRARKEISIGSIYSAQSKDWSNLIYEYRCLMQGNIKINIEQSTTQDLLRRVKDGRVDVVFCGKMDVDSDLAFYPCWTQEAALVVNRLHPLSKRSEVSLEELGHHYLISYRLNSPLSHEITQLTRGYNLRCNYGFNDEITLASIVAANPDVMAIACNSWLLHSFDNEVTRVKITEAPQEFRQIYLCYRADIEKPQVVESFIELTKKMFPEKEARL